MAGSMAARAALSSTTARPSGSSSTLCSAALAPHIAIGNSFIYVHVHTAPHRMRQDPAKTLCLCSIGNVFWCRCLHVACRRPIPSA